MGQMDDTTAKCQTAGNMQRPYNPKDTRSVAVPTPPQCYTRVQVVLTV